MSDDRYEKLDRCYRERLVRHLMRFGRQRQEAEDIAQRALMNTWLRLDSVDPRLEWAYLLTAANNIARTEHHREARQPVSLDSIDENTADPRVQVENRAIARVEVQRLQRAVRAVMNALPPETREAIVLRRLEYTSKEIARKLGLSPINVRTKLHRAEALFRERLGTPPPGVRWLDLAGEHDDDQR
jgi:RNA polymerase sigma factor (sigma-70 family)